MTHARKSDFGEALKAEELETRRALARRSRPGSPQPLTGVPLPRKKHTLHLKGGSKYDRDITLEVHDPKHPMSQIHLELRESDRESVMVPPTGEDPLDHERWIIQRAYYLLARRGFPSDSALADAMGVHRSQVSRWSQGNSLAQRENTWLLRDVASAVARLSDHYEPSTIQKWLLASNPELDGEVPMDLLRQGRLPEVLMAAEAQTSGAFA